MEIKKIKGHSGAEYSFVKIGKASLSDEPLKAKFNGKELENWKLKLDLLVNDILNSEQSCYLVCDDDRIIYVGYYSTSFRDRWWKKNGYFWHGEVVDNAVNKLLNNEPTKNITVWLSVNPYAYTLDKIKINISKFIEDDIIMSQPDVINTVGKNSKGDTKPVAEILGICNDCLKNV